MAIGRAGPGAGALATTPGAIVVDGDFAQGPAGTLVVEVGGTAPGAFDVLDVRGDVRLGGTLVLRFLDGYLPQAGDKVTAESSLGDVESVKAVSEVLSPVSGTVSAVNDALSGAPETINAAPYETWLVEVTDATAFSDLLDAAAYQAVCEQA